MKLLARAALLTFLVGSVYPAFAGAGDNDQSSKSDKKSDDKHGPKHDDKAHDKALNTATIDIGTTLMEQAPTTRRNSR
jgi:hypothetical protein